MQISLPLSFLRGNSGFSVPFSSKSVTSHSSTFQLVKFSCYFLFFYSFFFAGLQKILFCHFGGVLGRNRVRCVFFNQLYLTSSSYFKIFEKLVSRGCLHIFNKRDFCLFVCRLSWSQTFWSLQCAKLHAVLWWKRVKTDGLPILSYPFLRQFSGTALWGFVYSSLFTKDFQTSHWRLGFERKSGWRGGDLADSVRLLLPFMFFRACVPGFPDMASHA